MIMHHAKSILCLNGDLPDKDFFTEDKIIIAADGAADKLLEMGVVPSVIIGDLDSVDLDNHQNIKIIQITDQDKSDFQKALEYSKDNNLFPSVICGVNGGFIDQIFNNINIIAQHGCVLYAPPIVGYIVDAELTLEVPVNSKISLFAMPKAKVRTIGLKWNLDSAQLEFPGFNSSSNRTVSKNIYIEVLEGKILALIYLDAIEDAGSAF